MHPQQPRQALLAAAAAGKTYEFLRGALRSLKHTPDDDELRLLAVSNLSRVGLFGPALELLDDRPALLATAPELARAADTFRRQPSGRVAWRDRHALFARNLARLRERMPQVQELADRLEAALAGLELFCCRDGNLLLSRRRAAEPREWLPDFLDWPLLATRIDQLPAGREALSPPYLIESLALGHLAQRAFDRTRRMLHGYSPRIHILEPSAAQLAAWLHAGDWSEILASPRFHLWLGPDGADRFIEWCLQNPQEGRPVWVVRQPAWDVFRAGEGQRVVNTLSEETERTVRQTQARIRERLGARSAFRSYADRFAARRHTPLRILGATSRYTTFLQYSMRDIAEAARAAGHEFRILSEANEHVSCVPRQIVLREIEEFQPDLMLIIDHNRHEYGDAYDLPVPYCNWIQDDLPHLFAPGAGNALHPYDIVVGLISSHRAAPSGYPRAQWRFVPTPVSRSTFSPQRLPADELARHACDISFVTNLSITADELVRRTLAEARQPELHVLLPALFEEIGSRAAAGRFPASIPQTIAVTQEVARRLNLEVDYENANRIRQFFTERLINIHFRQQVLEWAADLGLDLRIYGRGWEQHPRLARFARGVAEHGRELRCIYQASRINLQALPSGAVHQRLLEGLSAGGFFLVRRTAFDTLGALAESIRRRCIEGGIRTEDALWNADDAQLVADVRALNERLYAPHRLYAGFAADQHVIAERGYPMEAGLLLPRYDEVSFDSRAELAALAARFLHDEPLRAEIAEAQRRAVEKHFSYDTVIERVLAFAECYLRSRAEREPAAASAQRSAAVASA